MLWQWSYKGGWKDTFSLWVDESKKQEVQREGNFTHLCYDHGCRRWSAGAAPQSGSSGPWPLWYRTCGSQAAEGEWASTEAWPGAGRQSRPFPGRPLEVPLGPSSPTAPQWKQRSGLGLDQRIGLLLGAAPAVRAGCLTGAGLPPSPPDHHSVGPKPDMKTWATEKGGHKSTNTLSVKPLCAWFLGHYGVFVCRIMRQKHVKYDAVYVLLSVQ